MAIRLAIQIWDIHCGSLILLNEMTVLNNFSFQMSQKPSVLSIRCMVRSHQHVCVCLTVWMPLHSQFKFIEFSIIWNHFRIVVHRRHSQMKQTSIIWIALTLCISPPNGSWVGIVISIRMYSMYVCMPLYHLLLYLSAKRAKMLLHLSQSIG